MNNSSEKNIFISALQFHVTHEDEFCFIKIWPNHLTCIGWHQRKICLSSQTWKESG